MTTEQIKRLDAIKEGRKLYVGFYQGGAALAFVDGQWVPRDPPQCLSWEVRTPGVKARAFILPTDSVHLVGARAVQGIRVDLSGRRIAHSKANFALFNSGMIDRKGIPS